MGNKLFLAKEISIKLGIYNFARRFYRLNLDLKRKGNYHKILREGKSPLPSTVYFEPTMRCNLRCKMCYLNFDLETNEKELTLDQIIEMFDNLPDTITYVVVSGGEPLLKKDIDKLFTYFEKHRILVTLLSNLTSTVTLEKILKSNLITVINTSIDGPEDLHNEIRGWDKAFQKVKEGINLVKESGIKDVLFPVCVITEYNLEHLKDIVQIVKDMGFNSLIFEFERRYSHKNLAQSSEIIGIPLENFRVVESENALPPYSLEQLKLRLKEVSEYAKLVGVKLSFLPLDLCENIEEYYFREVRKGHKLFCDVLLSPRIDPYGNLFPCMVIKKKFGNLLKRDFENIWNDEEFRKYRFNLLRNNLLPICETCYSCKKISRL